MKAGTPPESWAELLPWWDDQRAAFADGPHAPAWQPFTVFAPTMGSWARRQAHEAAIHRLDAELALGRGTVTFDREFATDGIDELLTMLVHRRADWSAYSAKGTVLVHAEDAGRVWSVRLAPGEAPHFDEQPFEAGVTIEGPASQVYPALWGRPSEAKVTGDAALLEPLAAP